MKVSKGLYIMLCLFLGGAGIHKFYAGMWIAGLLYLALCCPGIPIVLSLFDLLVAIFNRADDYGEIYV